jgi:hypothetical protein
MADVLPSWQRTDHNHNAEKVAKESGRGRVDCAGAVGDFQGRRKVGQKRVGGRRCWLREAQNAVS